MQLQAKAAGIVVEQTHTPQLIEEDIEIIEDPGARVGIVDEAEDLAAELAAASYMDTLSSPGGIVLSGEESMPSPDSSTFAKGKSINKFGVTTSYLDGICDTTEPFLDSE
jgi:hypothetical protein